MDMQVEIDIDSVSQSNEKLKSLQQYPMILWKHSYSDP